MRRAARFTLFVAALAATSPANADDETDLAQSVYKGAAAAYARGEFPQAAREMARADALKPNDTVLEFALRAAVLADDAVLVMTLVERAKERGEATVAATGAEAARAKFERRVGRLTVGCARGCVARVDGTPATVGTPAWVTLGSHRVEFVSGGHTEGRLVTVTAAGQEVLSSTPGEPGPDDHEAPRGASPSPDDPWAHRGAVVAVGAGLTALGTALAVASFVDTSSKHDEFLASQRKDQGLQSDGQSAETRSWVIAGVTGVVALATLYVGIRVIGARTKHSEGASASALFGVTPSAAGIGARF